MSTETSSLIKEEALKLLKKLQIDGSVNVTPQEGFYEIDITTEESGLLIGYHGNTLNSFQLILTTIVFKKLAKWEKVVVNVGDYRQKREETLKNLGLQYAQEAMDSQQEVILPYLTAQERRIIHLALQNHPQVISESRGIGRDRRLTIKLKSATE